MKKKHLDKSSLHLLFQPFWPWTTSIFKVGLTFGKCPWCYWWNLLNETNNSFSLWIHPSLDKHKLFFDVFNNTDDDKNGTVCTFVHFILFAQNLAIENSQTTPQICYVFSTWPIILPSFWLELLLCVTAVGSHCNCIKLESLRTAPKSLSIWLFWFQQCRQNGWKIALIGNFVTVEEKWWFTKARGMFRVLENGLGFDLGHFAMAFFESISILCLVALHNTHRFWLWVVCF